MNLNDLSRGGVKFLVDMRKDVLTAMKELDKGSMEFKVSWIKLFLVNFHK